MRGPQVPAGGNDGLGLEALGPKNPGELDAGEALLNVRVQGAAGLAQCLAEVQCGTAMTCEKKENTAAADDRERADLP